MAGLGRVFATIQKTIKRGVNGILPWSTREKETDGT